jgi:predicted O-methyltransferase YrrM
MNKSPETVITEMMKDVGGWFTIKEGMAFYNHAKNVKGEGVIVEIGSWQGKSTICLGMGSLAGSKVPVYAIDPHIGSSEHHAGEQKVWTFDTFKKNIETHGVTQVVRPIVKMSWDAVGDVNEKIEFLFIDGAHDYDSVKKDIADWVPKLIDGGIVCFHDSDWPGVMQALKEDIYYSDRMVDIHRVYGTTFARKVARNTAADRLANRLKWIQFSWPIGWRNFRHKYLKNKK